MSHLIIKHIGSIEWVDINLNKVNILMGPQSSGKSTINKIACYCAWVEKKVSLEQSFKFFLRKGVFLEELSRFHKLSGYFKEDSEIQYSSDVISLTYKQTDSVPFFEWKNQFCYQRIKLSYIPAERNIVSMISDWKEVSLPNNNIRNFMTDWNNARKIFTKDAHAHLPYLNIEYFYDERKDIDYIQNKDGSTIQLMNASSGLQSIIPLFVLQEYFREWIYKNEEPKSILSEFRDDELASTLTAIKEDVTREEWAIILNRMERSASSRKSYSAKPISAYFIDSYLLTFGTHLFIEEPELNLFPSTQKELLYSLIQSVQKRDEDKLIITTHSPYVLYALNNCMTGYLVKDNLPEETIQSLASHNAWINPELVSAWEIKEGKLVDIKTSRLGTFGDHYFNSVMNEVMDEYYVMLKYIKRT